MNCSKRVRELDVPRRVMDEIKFDAEWRTRLEKATTLMEKRSVVKRFCLDRGYPIHHNVLTGRLVVCRN